MKIDRSRFLTITGAIAAATAATAASACSPQPPPVVAVPAEQDPDAASQQPAATSTSVAIATAEPASPSEAPPTHPTEEGRVLGLGDSDSDTNSAAPYSFKGRSCPAADNMKGNPGSCANLKAPGPTCESFNDTKAQCNNLRTMFKPRVAEKIVECHQRRSQTVNICKFNLANDCVIEALPETCIDPGAASTCKPVMQKCGTTRWGKMSAESCAAAVSAISDAQKTKFVSCITEFCRLETCVYSYIPTQESGKRPIFRR